MNTLAFVSEDDVGGEYLLLRNLFNLIKRLSLFEYFEDTEVGVPGRTVSTCSSVRTIKKWITILICFSPPRNNFFSDPAYQLFTFPTPALSGSDEKTH